MNSSVNNVTGAILMNYVFSLSGLLSIVTLLAIFGGMGWFAYKMYKLSAQPRVELIDKNNKHSPQH